MLSVSDSLFVLGDLIIIVDVAIDEREESDRIGTALVRYVPFHLEDLAPPATRQSGAQGGTALIRHVPAQVGGKF